MSLLKPNYQSCQDKQSFDSELMKIVPDCDDRLEPAAEVRQQDPPSPDSGKFRSPNFRLGGQRAQRRPRPRPDPGLERSGPDEFGRIRGRLSRFGHSGSWLQILLHQD